MACYQEAFPTGYLLALAPDAATTKAELADHLTPACRSGKPAARVNCRLLDSVCAPAITRHIGTRLGQPQCRAENTGRLIQ